MAQSIAGGWLGTYYYSDASIEPTRFEATFSVIGLEGRFSGRILDDNLLGEANVADGMQTGREIVFTKTYIRPPAEYETAPVHYSGTLSEDGKRVQGIWRLQIRVAGRLRSQRIQGTWEARRLWAEAAETEERVEEYTRELAGVRG